MTKLTEDQSNNANTELYAGLLEKYIKHIVYHESITYTSDSKLDDSDVKFTEEEIKILQDIAMSV